MRICKLAICLVALLLTLSTSVAQPRPNIVLIMADDMGFSDLGCYGGEIETPNLDRLAAGGLRFTQFYNTGRCCPTRASLMTGLYPHQAGIGHMMQDYKLPGYQADLDQRSVTIAEVLKEAGYATYMTGKWHVTKQVGHWSGNQALTSRHNWPRQRGFDRFYGTIHGGGDYFNPVSLLRDNTPVEPEGEDFYYTDAISRTAARFVDDNPRGKPFFLYVAYTAPHWPLHARPAELQKYANHYTAGWDVLRRERYARMIELGIVDAGWPLTPRDPDVPAWEDAEDKDWQARRMAVYAAQIDRMDQGIGWIVDKLKEKGLLENTLILFLADNGGCAEEIRPQWKGLHIPEKTLKGKPVRVGNLPEFMPGSDETYQSYGLPWANASNTPLRLYKHWVHEGGISSPLIVHWPAGFQDRGRLRRDPAHLIDIMPTCIELARAAYPSEYKGNAITPLEGVSLVGLFRGQPLPSRTLFWEHEGNRAVREGKWKLVSQYQKDWELYDVDSDRTETNNLAAQMAESVRRLAEKYEQWAKRANVVPWKSWSAE